MRVPAPVSLKERERKGKKGETELLIHEARSELVRLVVYVFV